MLSRADPAGDAFAGLCSPSFQASTNQLSDLVSFSLLACRASVGYRMDPAVPVHPNHPSKSVLSAGHRHLRCGSTGIPIFLLRAELHRELPGIPGFHARNVGMWGRTSGDERSRDLRVRSWLWLSSSFGHLGSLKPPNVLSTKVGRLQDHSGASSLEGYRSPGHHMVLQRDVLRETFEN